VQQLWTFANTCSSFHLRLCYFLFHICVTVCYFAIEGSNVDTGECLKCNSFEPLLYLLKLPPVIFSFKFV
jgi:hypothetical protein